jgi:hypothetical protein
MKDLVNIEKVIILVPQKWVMYRAQLAKFIMKMKNLQKLLVIQTSTQKCVS